MLSTAFLSMGSNLGDRLQWLNLGLNQIKDTCGKVIRTSSVFETQAWGKEDQPDFLNCTLELQTELSPISLLHKIQDIEERCKRERSEQWGPRTLDIDILLMGEQVLNNNHLTIPHPYLHTRNFVLTPLAEIASGKEHPVLREKISALLSRSGDKTEVKFFCGPLL